MYSQSITEQNLAAVGQSLGIKLVQYDDSAVDDMTEHLVGLVKSYDKDGRPQEWHRQPTTQEWDYINNERVVCKFDFQYFARRYAVIDLAAIEGRPSISTGRLGTVGFMQPQEVFLEKLGKREEEMYEDIERGHMVDGLRFYINKGRQLHITAIARMLSMHRTMFWPDMYCITASINDDMTGELYRRDKMIYDHMPWFLRPDPEFDVKNQQLTFQPLGSGVLYHQANQHGGLGMGRMLTVAHMTEVAFWDDAYPGACAQKLDYHLRAAIPQSMDTLYILESTSNGMGGWWYDQIQLILQGKSTFDLFFAPWFCANRKYRRNPPIGWEPSDYAKTVADRAERTSFDYIGRTVRLDREQMYWYETEMASYEKRLGIFLSNYPTTLGEAFQRFSDSAFPLELLAELRRAVGPLHGSYDFSVS